MEIWQAMIMGIVEGVTEFLPVSSTGHLVIVSRILGIEPSQFLTTFQIIIQLGALAALIPLAIRLVWRDKSLIGKVIIACIPVILIGLFLFDAIAAQLAGSLVPIAIALIVGGVLILIIESWYERSGQHAISDREGVVVSWRDSLIVGLVQILALFPGVSRSGATIMGGLVAGMSRRAVAEFSFLLAFPILLGASLLDLIKIDTIFSSHEWVFILVGIVAAFFSALLVVRVFLSFISKRSFRVFGWYRIIIGTLILVFVGVGVLW
ncbi:MAG: undecaprenyl-diphosphate phosphatase [Candidatus Pacebacteria bacterium]|nr:undecaprenyl-diphosphate phosphatase [Candidatus Paceibacterota bacterium]